MTENLSLWSALEHTDPKHTKAFNRAGGFRGTATKPIYNIKRMTAQFGPCGVGWGWTQPTFQVVDGDGELLVFCTVALWHGQRDNLVYGVGGDKIVSKRKDGSFNNDEAFKAAYTDAQSNAMKMIGVGADIHMGMFEDDKYLRELHEDFKEDTRSTVEDYAAQASQAISEIDNLSALDDWVQANLQHLNALPAADGKTLRAIYERRRTYLQGQAKDGHKGTARPPAAPLGRGIDLDDEIPF